MKTTFDLPEELVNQLKLRAVRERRKLKDLAADLLRRGLAGSPGARTPPQVRIRRDRKTGLPVIQCPGGVPRGASAEKIAGLLADQEIEWLRETA
jgi:plasmid stability protein